MRRLAFFAVLIAAPACRISLEKEYEEPPDGPIPVPCQQAAAEPNPTAAFLEQNMFKTGCTASSCHGSSMPQDDQDLTTGHAWMSMVNVDAQEEPGYKVVVPGQPSQSYLMVRIRAIAPADMTPPVAAPAPEDEDDFYMPQQNVKLCSQKIDAVRRWIEQGALP